MSRWHEGCMGHCDDCMSSINICLFQKKYLPEETFRRSMTLGSVRYGMRVGAVSPPPPGAGGVRYRSQSCWPSSPCGDGVCDNLSVSQIPLLTVTPINSSDIISCANKTRANTENTLPNELPSAQNQRASPSTSPLRSPSSPTFLPTPSSVVAPTAEAPSQDQSSPLQTVSVRSEEFIHEQSPSSVSVTVTTPNQCALLKTHLKRYALVRPQVYSKLAEYAANSSAGDKNNIQDYNIPDHLHKFHFGVNRASVSAEKRISAEQRYRDFADRLKKNSLSPVPPPRTRHSIKIAAPSPIPVTAAYPLLSSCHSTSSTACLQNQSHSHSPNLTEPQQNFNSDSNVIKRGENNNNICDINNTQQNDEKDIKIHEIHNSNIDINISNNPEKILDSKQSSSPTIPTRHTGNISDRRRDKFKRRKGIYFSQWSNNSDNSTSDIFPQLLQDENLSNTEYTAKLLEDSLLEISKIRPDTPNLSDKKRPRSPSSLNNQDQQSPNIRNFNSSSEWPTIQNLSELKLSSSDFLKLISNDLGSIKSDSFSDCEQDINANTSNHHQHSNSLSNDVGDKHLSVPTIKIHRDHAQMVADAEMKHPYPGSREDIKKSSNLEGPTGPNLLSMNSLSLKIKRDIFKGSSSNSLTELSAKDNDQGNSANEFPKFLHKPTENTSQYENGRDKLVIRHQHSSSSPSKLGVFEPPKENSASFEQLFRNSSEQLPIMDISQKLQNDTRTHVVVELYDNERSYVESLEILVTRYLEPLKAPENAHLLEPNLVEEIFYQIPSLLSHHSSFLEDLKKRLENWDIKQTIGDLFLEMLSKSLMIDNYTDYVNNWKKAREKLKCAEQSKPAFSRFLEVTARQHLGKLSLDALLIKPIQKFPKYELLIQRLLKHTEENHPDYCLLLAAQKQVHDQLLKINCSEKETLELEQLREIEGLIDGLIELVTTERQYLRHDLVSMSHGGYPRRERALFLFSDLLLITGIKRRSGTIRKPPNISPASSVTSTLEANKYKLLMKIPLEDIEIRSKDDNCRQIVTEVNNISEDISILNQINELTSSLHCNHSHLEEVLREMLASLNKQLSEQQSNESQLACLDLTISTSTGLENVSIAFSKPEKRTSWEESLVEAKQKLAISSYRRHFPELLATVPIRKTRAGLQFTCAVPNIGEKGKDVWVCNSDGYVGQVCILSLSPEPTVKSCNGVCNAKILCISSVPGFNNRTTSQNSGSSADGGKNKTSHFDSSSSSDEDDTFQCEENEDCQKCYELEDCTDNEETDIQQSTMWLGTEDGCIFVYNSDDNIRVKKNKIKLQLGASILSIVYLENRVFVSLANGNIHVYDRDCSGLWNIETPSIYIIGSLSTPVSKMVPGTGKLWCVCGNAIKIINTENVIIENSFSVSNDANKLITCIVLSGYGVWLSLQNSGVVKCYHTVTFELLCEINVAPAVTKMLTSCDDIIRQHKAACLRITALVICKDLLWIGTSAGVILIMPLPHILPNSNQLTTVPTVSGVPYGHTGHVRLLTCVEMPVASLTHDTSSRKHQYKTKREQRSTTKLIVISGGDGYEDFRTTNISEVAGREDSTNHLLLWNV